MTSEHIARWGNFYSEFASRLLDHKDNRGPLVTRVREICNDLGHHYLDHSGTADETNGLQDICPFTVMGTFNRGISTANRKTIAGEIGRFLGVTHQVPNSFDGIPTLNNQNSVVFWQRSDIAPLWGVFENALRFADGSQADSQRLFLESYNRVRKASGLGRKLTIGLFWVRPGTFLALDNNSERYVSSLGIEVPRQNSLSGRQYLDLTQRVKDYFLDADSPAHSFPDLSWKAYEAASKEPTLPVWMIRAGRKGEYENAALERGLAIVDWGVGDLSNAGNKESIQERVKQTDPDASNERVGSITGQLALFCFEIEDGDIVVMPSKIRADQVALGRIKGPYTFQDIGTGPYHTRPVEWIRTDIPTTEFGETLKGYRKTVSRIKGIEAGRLIASMLDMPVESQTGGADETGPPAVPYSLQDIVDEGCFLDESKLKMILNRLKIKKNLILQGPPGTGKTWLARKLAFALIGQRDSHRVHGFQFHPNLSYEDFVRGFRPDSNGRLSIVDGPFLRIVAEAHNDPSNDYVLVIEEVNRGNPAQIFGEMLTLLEADKRNPSQALRLAHSVQDNEVVHIPPNLYVIGTMNVADRSIAMVDMALRRRFAFIDLEPTFGELWKNWVTEHFGLDVNLLTTIESRIEALNDRIVADPSLGPQFRVGHSFVTPPVGTQLDNPIEWFAQVVETEIGPLLDEYWFDKLSEAEDCKAELLRDLQ